MPVKFAAVGSRGRGFRDALAATAEYDFSGKTVLISGALTGARFRRPVCAASGSEHANVVLLARDQDRLSEAAQELKRYGIATATRQCDVTKPEEVRRAVTSMIDEFRSIDVLVNNAGIIQVGPAENMNRDDYADAIGGPFLGSVQSDG